MSPIRLACAIETSSRTGSVAVYTAEGGVCAARFKEGMQHGRELIPRLQQLLDQTGHTLGQLQLIACGLGPGSYTGLRIGVVAARSLAWALSCPMLGVSSLDAVAAALPPGRPRAAVADARRQALYFASYPAQPDPLGHPAQPHRCDKVEALVAELAPGTLVAGPGLHRYGELLESAGHRLARTEQWTPDAGALLRLALARYQAGEAQDLHTIAPMYLREAVPGWKG